MADRNALGLMGLMLGITTAFVVVVGAVLVTDHAPGDFQLADRMQGMQTAALSSKAR